MPFKGVDDEQELLLRVSRGDREAFQTLYTACYPYVQRYVSLFERSARVLDELTQDVFVRIWEKRAKLAEVGSFKGYLFLVTRNVVFNYIRAHELQNLQFCGWAAQ